MYININCDVTVKIISQAKSKRFWKLHFVLYIGSTLIFL